MDESRPISAKDIIADPDAVMAFTNFYIMVSDSSVTGSHTSMIEAINLLAERNWEVVGLSSDNSRMVAVCKNLRRKRKNEMFIVDDE